MLAMLLPMLTVVMVQNVPGPPGDEAMAVPRLIQPRRCAGNGDDIVVCGGGLQSQRLEPLPEMPPDPVFKLVGANLSGGKTLNAHAEEGGGYTQTPRLMVTLKVPF